MSIIHTSITFLLILCFSPLTASDYWQSRTKFDCFYNKKTEEINHLAKKIVLYLDGKDQLLSKEIIKKLKEFDNNIRIFNCLGTHLQETKNVKEAEILSSLLPVLFDRDSIQKLIHVSYLTKYPQVVNKGLFALKMPFPRYSSELEDVSKTIKYLYCENFKERETGCKSSYFINENIGSYDIINEEKTDKVISQEQKKYYWESSFKPTYYPEFMDSGTVRVYREKIKHLLLIVKRFEKEKKSKVDKRLVQEKIILPLFEQGFTEFEDHCNSVGTELSEKTRSVNIEDQGQKLFFSSCKEWYEQEKLECFKNLRTFGTVQKILSYKITDPLTRS